MRLRYLLICCTFLGIEIAQAGPAIETWQTSNGAKVFFVRAPELPMIDVRVAFDAGSARDAALPGLAVFTNSMLSEGAGKLSAEVISERIENVGAVLNNDSQRDLAWVGLRSLTEPAQYDVAVDILSLVLRAPSFTAPVIERTRKLLLTGLKQRMQNPAAVAEDLFYAALYPKHPYGKPTEGDANSLGRIKRTDILNFYRRYYVARNALVAIVGDLQRVDAERLANRVAGKLPEGQAAEAISQAPQLAKPAVIKQRYPSSQTHIRLGQATMRRPDVDFYPLYLANHALGGNGLVSVLADKIREQRGLSYSVSSHFIGMRAAGPFEAAIETRNSQADEALQVLQKTVDDFIADGPTDSELDAAKKNLTGGFPLRIDSNAEILEYLVSIGFYGLPLDYLDKFVGNIERVTPAEIRDALQRRLNPESFVTIIVGGTPQADEAIPAPAPRPSDLH